MTATVPLVRSVTNANELSAVAATQRVLASESSEATGICASSFLVSRLIADFVCIECSEQVTRLRREFDDVTPVDDESA